MAGEKRCRCCRGFFNHPQEIKSYGGSFLCLTCFQKQTRCDGCQKRRFDKVQTERGMLCDACFNNAIENANHNYDFCGGCKKYFFQKIHHETTQAEYGIENPDYKLCDTCFEEARVFDDPVPYTDCYICGAWTHHKDVGDGDEINICGNCLEQHPYTPCPCCETMVNNYTGTRNGLTLYCNACFTVKFIHCRGCGDTKPREGSVEVGKYRDNYCADCAKTMGACKNCHQRGFLKGGYCGGCRENMRKCGSCGQLAFDVVGTNHGYACPDCRHEHGWGVQRRYNYRPEKFNFYGQGSLWLGIENEIALDKGIEKDDYLDHIAKVYHAKQAYAQHDGTIDYGTELVFHPMSLYRINKFPFEDMFTEHVRKDNKSCGMHVHLTKAAFSKIHLYRFMKFISTNQQFVGLVAGRPNKLEKDHRGQQKLGYETTVAELLLEKTKGKTVNGHKYVDMLVHDQTAELRVFKGALSAEEVRKNCEFCQALYDFTQKHTKGKQLTALAFFQYVRERASAFPLLSFFLETHYDKVAECVVVPTEKHIKIPTPLHQPKVAPRLQF